MDLKIMDEGILRIFETKHRHSQLEKAKLIGKKIHYFDRVSSTNDLAFALAMKDKKNDEE